MKKICFVLTVEFALKAFLVEHLKELSQNYEISVVVNTNNPNLLKELGINAKLIPMNIARDISPWVDLKVLVKLSTLFFSTRFDAVHTVTPKAGLLGMLASTITLTKYRIHTFQGEVWLTKKGVMRRLLKALDKLVGILATHLTIVSGTERDFLIAEKIISSKKSFVFCSGSIAGVNTNRFKPNIELRKKIRDSLGILENDSVILFLGRLNRDKGILDLANAFLGLTSNNAHLLIVGPDEHDLVPKINNILSEKKDFVHFNDETNQPEMFMVAADLICLPSYREGFGVVIIEAAACGIPAVASRIYGISDAIVENTTGLMHEVRNVSDLKNKLEQMISNRDFRESLGKNAYQRATTEFNSKLVTKAWCDFYRDVIFKHD